MTLGARAAHDLVALGLPPAGRPAEVVGPDGAPIVDVLVVGAGMLDIVAALAFKSVRNIRMVDRAQAGREGPWTTDARMDFLRFPKHLPGPCPGIPGVRTVAVTRRNTGRTLCRPRYQNENLLMGGASFRICAASVAVPPRTDHGNGSQQGGRRELFHADLLPTAH